MKKRNKQNVKVSKKSASKKSVGKSLPKNKRVKKTSPKPRTNAKAKTAKRKPVKRTRTGRPRKYDTRKKSYTRKLIRTPRKYLSGRNKAAFAIKKKTEKLVPKLKVSKKSMEVLAKKVKKFRGKSKAKVWTKLEIKDYSTGQTRWVSTIREAQESGLKVELALDTLFESLESGEYGKSGSLKIRKIEIEVND